MFLQFTQTKALIPTCNTVKIYNQFKLFKNNPYSLSYYKKVFNSFIIRVSQKHQHKIEERYDHAFALPRSPEVPETIHWNCKPESLVSYPQNTNHNTIHISHHKQNSHAYRVYNMTGPPAPGLQSTWSILWVYSMTGPPALGLQSAWSTFRASARLVRPLWGLQPIQTACWAFGITGPPWVCWPTAQIRTRLNPTPVQQPCAHKHTII